MFCIVVERLVSVPFLWWIFPRLLSVVEILWLLKEALALFRGLFQNHWIYFSAVSLYCICWKYLDITSCTACLARIHSSKVHQQQQNGPWEAKCMSSSCLSIAQKNPFLCFLEEYSYGTNDRNFLICTSAFFCSCLPASQIQSCSAVHRYVNVSIWLAHSSHHPSVHWCQCAHTCSFDGKNHSVCMCMCFGERDKTRGLQYDHCTCHQTLSCITWNIEHERVFCCRCRKTLYLQFWCEVTFWIVL